MQKYPLELVEDLASLDAQVRWIIHGTEDEYLVPEEMMHEAHRFCELVKRVEAPSTARQRAAVEAFCRALRTHDVRLDRYDRSNIEALIYSDPDWNSLRAHASEVMEAFAPLPYD